MIVVASEELTRQAMDSRCVICGKDIKPWHLWTYSETRRHTLIFSHKQCLFKSNYKNKGEGK